MLSVAASSPAASSNDTGFLSLSHKLTYIHRFIEHCSNMYTSERPSLCVDPLFFQDTVCLQATFLYTTV